VVTVKIFEFIDGPQALNKERRAKDLHWDS